DALQIRRDLEKALEARTEAELRESLADLNRRIAALNSLVTEGPPTTLAPVDVYAIVGLWRGSGYTRSVARTSPPYTAQLQLPTGLLLYDAWPSRTPLILAVVIAAMLYDPTERLT